MKKPRNTLHRYYLTYLGFFLCLRDRRTWCKRKIKIYCLIHLNDLQIIIWLTHFVRLQISFQMNPFFSTNNFIYKYRVFFLFSNKAIRLHTKWCPHMFAAFTASIAPADFHHVVSKSGSLINRKHPGSLINCKRGCYFEFSNLRQRIVDNLAMWRFGAVDMQTRTWADATFLFRRNHKLCYISWGSEESPIPQTPPPPLCKILFPMVFVQELI